MDRRDFSKAALGSTVTLWLGACGGGGGGGSGGGGGGPVGEAPAASPPVAAGPAPAPGVPAPAPQPAQVVPLVTRYGTNLAGMEWGGSVRLSPDVRPNLEYTVPRAATVRWLASQGFGRNRLPVMWELLQPMLVDTVANAQARALIGEPGAFNEPYARYIDGVLDAHAQAGATCILDLHNYCRYRDFIYRADGSVAGLVRPADPTAQAYTGDPSQVFTRIFATAPGASLRPAAFADFWTRAATRWKGHPGLGGYCIMNEPHDMPQPGNVLDTDGTGLAEDLAIWPVFARAAIAAIRAVDAEHTIYLMGNAWGGSMNIGPQLNPEWPLPGVSNVVYEVHSYVDAWNNGNGFNWELEQAKNFTAGFGVGPQTVDTGLNRMRIATDWAHAHGVRISVNETGMPFDDPRWIDAFRRMAGHIWDNGWEFQTWAGGDHWALRSHGINQVPGWHQGQTVEPMVGGEMKTLAGADAAVLFDDGGGWSAGGAPVTITVWARGNLAAPVTLAVSSDAGGSFSKQQLVIPAGANGQDSYTFTPAPGTVATLRYSAARQVPPPRTVYAIADPVARAAANLPEGARAILARYNASLWSMADAFTDFLLGHPAAEGESVRAVADSGWGSSPGNPLEMLNWMNQDSAAMGSLRPGVMRRAPRVALDLTADGATGLWCHKQVPGGAYPNTSQRLGFGLQDPHFVLAAVTLPAGSAGGTVFQAGVRGAAVHAELAVANGQAQARWSDSGGSALVLAGPALAAGTPAVLALTGGGGRQQLRVNGAAVASGARSFAPEGFGDLLLGWGDPQRGAASTFRGHVHAAIAGPGAPTDAELAVLERYLASLAG